MRAKAEREMNRRTKIQQPLSTRSIIAISFWPLGPVLLEGFALPIMHLAVADPNPKFSRDLQRALFERRASADRHLTAPPLRTELQRSPDGFVGLLAHDNARPFVANNLTPKHVAAVMIGDRPVQADAEFKPAQPRTCRHFSR
jgi:hypothetical protein